jgi:hypothetical protein
MNDSAGIYKVLTRLRVDGFECDASVITALLDVEPTTTWRAGEREDSRPDNTCHQNAWVKDSPVTPCETTPEASVAALLALFPDVFAFARLPHPARVVVSTTLFGARAGTCFFLSSGFVAQLAVIGADFDLRISDESSEADTSADA